TLMLDLGGRPGSHFRRRVRAVYNLAFVQDGATGVQDGVQLLSRELLARSQLHIPFRLTSFALVVYKLLTIGTHQVAPLVNQRPVDGDAPLRVNSGLVIIQVAKKMNLPARDDLAWIARIFDHLRLDSCPQLSQIFPTDIKPLAFHFSLGRDLFTGTCVRHTRHIEVYGAA